MLALNSVSLVLMLACGLAWGGLYSLLVEVDYALANTGFWLTLIVTISAAAVFRHQIILQLLWIVVTYLPLSASLVFTNQQSGNDYLQVILVLLAIIFFPAFFPSRKRVIKSELQENEKLKKNMMTFV